MLGQSYYSYILLLIKALIVFIDLLGQYKYGRVPVTGSGLVAHFMSSAVVAVSLSFLQLVTTLKMMLILELFKEKIWTEE